MKKFIIYVVIVLMLVGGYCFVNAKQEEQAEKQRIEAWVSDIHSNMYQDSNGVWTPKDSGTKKDGYMVDTYRARVK